MTTPEFVPDSNYESALFRRKLIELGLGGAFAEETLASLGSNFTLEQLEHALQSTLLEHRMHHNELAPLVEQVVMLAKSNYEIDYAPEQNLSERLIFPFGPTESNGIEDARFVKFVDDEHVLGVVQRIAGRVGRRIDETTPMVDARLADGSRLNAIIPPLALDVLAEQPNRSMVQIGG